MCARIHTPTDVYLLVDCDVNTDRRQEQWDLAAFITSSLYPNAERDAVRLYIYNTGHVDGAGRPTLVHDATRFSPLDERAILRSIREFSACSATRRTSLSAGVNAIRDRALASGQNRNYIVAIITGRPDSELDSTGELRNALSRLVKVGSTSRVRPLVFYNDVGISSTLQSLSADIIYLWFYPVRNRMEDIASSLCEQLPASVMPVPSPSPTPPPPSPSMPPTAPTGKHRLTGFISVLGFLKRRGVESDIRCEKLENFGEKGVPRFRRNVEIDSFCLQLFLATLICTETEISATISLLLQTLRSV